MSQETKLSVFISYSRKDLDFADQLVAALCAFGFGITIDRQGIHGAEKWEERLSQLILEADTIVFILTPTSADSDVCRWEVDEAVKHGKRIVPILWQSIDNIKPHKNLQDLNYIYFYSEPTVPSSGFGHGLARLVAALSIDIDWIREHTRLSELATRWDTNGRPVDRLIRGSELVALRNWRSHRPSNAPELTTQQRVYLQASEEAQAEKESYERKRLDEMRLAQEAKAEALAVAAAAQDARARQQKKAGLGLIGLAVFLLVALTTAAMQFRSALERQSQAYGALSDAAFKEGNYDSAIRFALAGLKSDGVLEDLFLPWLPQVETQLVRAALSNQLRAIFREVNSDSLIEKKTIELHDLFHGSPVWNATFDPTGKMAAASLGSTVVTVWDVSDGQVIARLEDHSEPVVNVEFSPDSTLVATASLDGKARIWNARKGDLVSELSGHSAKVWHAGFSPKGDIVITVSSDQTAIAWDPISGTKLFTLEDIGLEVWKVVFSPDGSKVAFPGDLGGQLWDLHARKRLAHLSSNFGFLSLSFSHNSEMLIGGAVNSNAYVWNATSGIEVAQLTGHEGWVWAAHFSTNDKYIVTASSDTTVKLWDVAAKFEHLVELVGHENWVVSASFSSDDQQIVSTSRDGTAKIWSVENAIGSKHQPRVKYKALLHSFQGHEDAVWSAEFSPNNNLLLTASSDKSARLWKVRSPASHDNKNISPFLLEDKSILREFTNFRRSRISDLILARHKNGTTRLVDVAAGKIITEFIPSSTQQVIESAFSLYGSRVIAYVDNASLEIIDVKSRDTITSLEVSSKAKPSSAAFSFDEKTLAVGFDDGSLIVWNTIERRIIHQSLAHTMEIHSLGFGDNIQRLLSVSTDGTVRLWNTESWTQISFIRAESAPMDRTSGSVGAFSFTTDSKRFAITFSNGTVKLFDAATGLWISDLVRGASRSLDFTGLYFDANNSRIVSASGSWKVDPLTFTTGTDLIAKVCEELLWNSYARRFSKIEMARALSQSDRKYFDPCE